MTETRTEDRGAGRAPLANPRRTRLTGTHSGDQDVHRDAAEHRTADARS